MRESALSHDTPQDRLTGIRAARSDCSPREIEEDSRPMPESDTLTLARLRRELRAVASTTRARTVRRFFKTGPGEYAEGDEFLGVMVPQSRAIARRFASLRLADVRRLLRSRIHEERLVALLILVDR